VQPPQEHQTPGILQRADHLGPVRAPQAGDRLRDASLGHRRLVELTVVLEDLQGRGDLLPGRLDLLSLLQRADGSLPGTASPRGGLACITSLLLLVPDVTIGLLGLGPQAFGSVPDRAEETVRVPLGVEDIQAHLQWGLMALVSLLLDPRQAGVQAGPPIGQDRLQGGPVRQRRGPRGSTAIGDTLAQDPGHALRFDGNQHGLTTEEDLIEAGDQHQRLAGAVQTLQETARLDGLLMNPATHGRRSRTEGHGQEDGQQAGDLAGAQAHRRGHGGEAPLPVLGELNGLFQPRPELAVLLLEGLDLVKELLAGGFPIVLLFDSLLDALGMLVDRLPATPGRLGLVSDLAPTSQENGGGIADPGRDG
jgi:hypothetical protein